MLRAATLLLCLAAGPAAAQSCDALTARTIRVTGASLAGRTGSLAMFRAADAQRMSLDCRAPRRILLWTPAREPARAFFILVGLSAKALAGADARRAEEIALRLHQDALLTGLPQRAAAGRALIQCEPGDRFDGVSAGSLCRLVPAQGSVLRRYGFRRGALPG
ncbi:hypothetical protein [Methylobacterium organophilum]|uniref:Uncharacterized protein n=1 Tax=Methylobacterium organophilum TaxID=410 RepID=A0ABQ4T947_METOR|nr:hypothetical protein [Methylobacterium organophilum]UMY16998.1 hypothetical protein MMB17_20475 [Methylobacterium organophilum]GJE26979.1 hypothetical protein LKMONMHP_1835 [Methylobacterium organophilum]